MVEKDVGDQLRMDRREAHSEGEIDIYVYSKTEPFTVLNSYVHGQNLKSSMLGIALSVKVVISL